MITTIDRVILRARLERGEYPIAMGKHDPPPPDAEEPVGCGQELLSILVEERWSDSTACVDPSIAAFYRRWQDNIRDDALRMRLCGPLVVLMMGTRGSRELQRRRAWLAVDWAIRAQTPVMLRLAGLDDHAFALESLSEINSDATRMTARPIIDRVHDAARKQRNENCAKLWAYVDVACACACADAYAAAYACADADAAAAADADAADAAYACADAAAATDAAYAYAFAAYAADLKLITEAAKSGGYATEVAGETIGKRVWEKLAPTIERSHHAAADVVRRMCALRDES